MRLVAEYLENAAQLLLRLLQEPTVVGDIVQIGTYIVDGTPRIPEALTIDINSDSIKNGEAHIYLTGYWPLPDWLEVTLPDLTEERVAVVQVVEHGDSIITDQPIEANKPIEQDPLRPGESANPYTPMPTLPSEYPDLWVELSLGRTDPVRMGAEMTSNALIYTGGGAGRALSSTQKQVGTDIAPYLSYAPVRLEGAFTNSLVNSDFTLNPAWPSPYFDQLPNGWVVELADPLSLLRMQTDSLSVLPSFTLRFRHKPNKISNIPPVTVFTPPLTIVNETFQVILAPAPDTEGTVQLVTENDAVSSPTYTLIDGQPILATLPIGVNTGKVKIVWDTQKDGEQVLQLVAPQASLYEGGHSWIPTGVTSGEDKLDLANILFDKPWYFYKGSIRVDGQGDVPDQPSSWEIDVGGQSLLKIEAGILSSDFMTTAAVDITTYLPDVTRYKLFWISPTEFKIRSYDGATTSDLPFALDLTPVVDSTAALNVSLYGYKPNEGSATATRWAWLPN
jgi:hypothetical protein